MTLECAGNNRNFLEPKVKGVQWGLGAVGTAEWTGVPLLVLLDRAVVRSNAREVIFEGADCGMLDDPKSPPGELTFARSIPVEQSARRCFARLQNEWQANFPQNTVFLFVPLCQAGTRWRRSNGCSALLSQTSHSPVIIRRSITHTGRGEGTSANSLQLPRCKSRRKSRSRSQGETVPANSNVRVHGAAWTSDGEITKVELSTDGGSTWNETNLLGESKPNAWRLWEFNWKTPSVPGRQTLVARATDSLGQTQPVQRDPDRGTYMITHLLPILVQVS